jgi:hypothetical protein
VLMQMKQDSHQRAYMQACPLRHTFTALHAKHMATGVSDGSHRQQQQHVCTPSPNLFLKAN